MLFAVSALQPGAYSPLALVLLLVLLILLVLPVILILLLVVLLILVLILLVLIVLVVLVEIHDEIPPEFIYGFSRGVVYLGSCRFIPKLAFRTKIKAAKRPPRLAW